MNESKLQTALYALIALVVGNIALTGYLIYSGTRVAGAPADAAASAGEQVPKAAAMELASRLVARYNNNDLDGLYAEFSDVARMQFTKDKLRDSMTKLKTMVGKVDDYAYSHTQVVGVQDGKQYKTVFFKIRLSGGPISTGEMKVTVVQEGSGLGLYGFFINALEQ